MGTEFTIDKLKRGDVSAVSAWFRTYMPKMRVLVASKVSNTQDVDDICQEVFVNSLRQLPLYRGESSLWSWMCGIARHEIADYYRKRYAKRVLKTVPLFEHVLLQGSEKQDVDSDQSVVVFAILSQMKRRSAQMLQLKYFEKMSVKHMAKFLQRSVKAVESDLHRARREFKTIWNTTAVEERHEAR